MYAHIYLLSIRGQLTDMEWILSMCNSLITCQPNYYCMQFKIVTCIKFLNLESNQLTVKTILLHMLP